MVEPMSRRVLIAGGVALAASVALHPEIPGVTTPRYIYLRGWGGTGRANGRLDGPRGAAVSGNRVYVVDGANHRLQVFRASGEFLRMWGREGSANGSFRDPRDVAIDSEGRVLVTDTGNIRVQVFARGGRFLTQWSGATIAPSGFDPMGIAIDAVDTVYIADTDNDRIELFDSVF